MHCPVWKTRLFFLRGICVFILWQDYKGNGIWENPIKTWLGENSKLGMSLYMVKKDYSYLCMWMTQKFACLDPMLKLPKKRSLFGEPTSFLDHVYLGCTQRKCEISKDIVDNYRTMVESRISARVAEKLPFLQNLRISSWSHDMEGHAKKCVERHCELAQSINSMHRWPPLQRRRNEICWRIVKYMLSNCSEMLVLGTNWKTWHSMVSK